VDSKDWVVRSPQILDGGDLEVESYPFDDAARVSDVLARGDDSDVLNTGWMVLDLDSDKRQRCPRNRCVESGEASTYPLVEEVVAAVVAEE